MTATALKIALILIGVLLVGLVFAFWATTKRDKHVKDFQTSDPKVKLYDPDK